MRRFSKDNNGSSLPSVEEKRQQQQLSDLGRAHDVGIAEATHEDKAAESVERNAAVSQILHGHIPNLTSKTVSIQASPTPSRPVPPNVQYLFCQQYLCTSFSLFSSFSFLSLSLPTYKSDIALLLSVGLRIFWLGSFVFCLCPTTDVHERCAQTWKPPSVRAATISRSPLLPSSRTMATGTEALGRARGSGGLKVSL